MCDGSMPFLRSGQSIGGCAGSYAFVVTFAGLACVAGRLSFNLLGTDSWGVFPRVESLFLHPLAIKPHASTATNHRAGDRSISIALPSLPGNGHIHSDDVDILFAQFSKRVLKPTISYQSLYHVQDEAHLLLIGHKYLFKPPEYWGFGPSFRNFPPTREDPMSSKDLDLAVSAVSCFGNG